VPWIVLKDGTQVHVTMAKRGAKLTEKDIEALRELAEAARRAFAEKKQCGSGLKIAPIA
jgi:hypothetical protein